MKVLSGFHGGPWDGQAFEVDTAQKTIRVLIQIRPANGSGGQAFRYGVYNREATPTGFAYRWGGLVNYQ